MHALPMKIWSPPWTTLPFEVRRLRHWRMLALRSEASHWRRPDLIGNACIVVVLQISRQRAV